LELDGNIEIGVEEFGSQCDCGKMGREVGDIDSPRLSAGDLGAEFSSNFGRICVFPQIINGRRKSSVSR
jgi:hypothetical protein